MKKTYVYFIAPLAALVVFAGVYWKYAAGYQARMDAMRKEIVEKKAAKIHEENLQKKAAVEKAIKDQEERKRLKALKEQKEQEEKDNRERAIQARNKAREDARKFAERVKSLEKEVADNKKEIAQIEQDKKDALKEQAFLREYVKQTKVNTDNLKGVLERIAAADKAAAEAAKAAAEAAKAAKKK